MSIDVSKLPEALKVLTGEDMESAEREARLMGDFSPELANSKKYQAILAAKALGVVVDDIRALPARKYQAITSQVFSFLYSDMEGTETPSESTES